jgi:hypothetical protein
MHIRYSSGIGEIQLVEAFVKANTAGMEHGSHRAIGKQSLFGKGF